MMPKYTNMTLRIKNLYISKKYFIFAAESGEYMNSIDINNTGIKVDVSVFL